MSEFETIAKGVTLYPAECMAVLATLGPDSVDSCVTDPPYHLTSIVKRFGAENAAPAKAGKTGAYKRASAGFMGKQWDGGEIAFEPETWAAVYRVLKPGGHLLAFGAPKNFGFMQYAIAQAGFEVRDTLCWLFGSGFPKSHDVSKGIDKAAGAERAVVGQKRNNKGDSGGQTYAALGEYEQSRYSDVTSPATDAAIQWQGWGTALKPAYEPIIMARKPLIGTVAENVLKHGTGALNIDGCRVEVAAGDQKSQGGAINVVGDVRQHEAFFQTAGNNRDGLGRWPANVIHDGSDEVVGAFPETHSAGKARDGGEAEQDGVGGQFGVGNHTGNGMRFGDAGGSAARFFYTAKADSDDRLGSKHPTVKPVSLLRWLVRLVTPPRGLILDPFAGTGTTGEAAWREGMRAILIEREAEYCNDIRRRMNLVLGGPDERQRESIKARGLTAPAGPLFAEIWDEPWKNAAE